MQTIIQYRAVLIMFYRLIPLFDGTKKGLLEFLGTRHFLYGTERPLATSISVNAWAQGGRGRGVGVSGVGSGTEPLTTPSFSIGYGGGWPTRATRYYGQPIIEDIFGIW